MLIVISVLFVGHARKVGVSVPSKTSEYQPPEEVDAGSISSSSSSGDDSDDELSYDPTALEDKQLGFHFVS